MNIRCARLEDIIQMQHCNLLCMAENYKINYYYFVLLSWPQLSYVAENDKGNCVGYVLSKMGEGQKSKHGFVVSLAVKRRYRQFGLARKLISQSMETMVDCFEAQCAFLYARKSNRVACDLYASLEYKIIAIEPKYYADGEDAYTMRKDFSEFVRRAPSERSDKNHAIVFKESKNYFKNR